MGTLGSGRFEHAIPRLTTDQRPRLDVHTLHHAGALIDGACSRWQWEPFGIAVTIVAEATRIRIEDLPQRCR
jgi:hypothetical protein